jgi:hypothetical protein
MPRFVLLYHECPPGFIKPSHGFTKPSHWDFMLEADGVLKTWELRELPLSWQKALNTAKAQENRTVVATRLGDHRLEYLTYEGFLTDNRGSVTRVAKGTFHEIKDADNCLTVALQGQTIQGTAILNRIAETNEWHLSTAD